MTAEDREQQARDNATVLYGEARNEQVASAAETFGECGFEARRPRDFLPYLAIVLAER